MLEKGTVQDEKLLERSDRRFAFGAVRSGVGEVVKPEHVVHIAAVDEAVDRAAAVAGVAKLDGRTADPLVK